MLIGVGHDLQAVHELERVEGLWTPGVFFTQIEADRFQLSESPTERLAAGFAAKEALFKALPQIRDWFWTDAEVFHDERCAPRFRFHGTLDGHMDRHGWRARVSVSHSGGFVSAIVVIESPPLQEQHRNTGIGVNAL